MRITVPPVRITVGVLCAQSVLAFSVWSGGRQSQTSQSTVPWPNVRQPPRVLIRYMNELNEENEEKKLQQASQPLYIIRSCLEGKYLA